MLYSIDNIPGVGYRMQNVASVKTARRYVMDVENGVGRVQMPEAVRETYNEHCPVCGWEIVYVQVPIFKNQPLNTINEPIPVAPYPIPTVPGTMYSYTIDITFMGDTPIYSKGKNGAWVRHSALCNKTSEELNEPLLSVWRKCRDEYIDSLGGEQDMADLDDMEAMLNDLQ